MTRTEAEEAVGPESKALFCDGFDNCILGIASRCGFEEDLIAYDYDKMIAQMVSQGMTQEEAVEFFEFNIIGAWLGKGTPIFVRTENVESEFKSGAFAC